LVVEVVIDKSKGAPEFKLRSHARKESELPQEAQQLYRTPYLVVKDFSKNGTTVGYPLRSSA
jgi:hypothetical protein